MTGSLAAKSLGFRYPGGHGFWDVSFTAGAGEVTCIYGRNGSGKTTIFRVLSTLLLPQAGGFSLAGRDGIRNRDGFRRLIFPVADTSAHFDHLSGRENLAVFRFLYGVQASPVQEEVLPGHDPDLDRMAGAYSLGMKRKLFLMESFLCRRPALIFDEPALGLDSAARGAFFRKAREAADEGSCILILTNQAEDAIHADRLFRLEDGTLSPVASADELQKGLIRVTVTYPDRMTTGYIPSAGDLPDLVRTALAGGTIRKIELAGAVPPAGQEPGEGSWWTPEARARVAQAPRFLRPMITALVERHARDAGYDRITPEVVGEAKGRFDRQ